MLEIIGFLLEEIIACLTETFEYLGVYISRRKAYRLPLGLQRNNLLSCFIPVVECFEIAQIHCFYLLAKRGLLFKIFVFLCFLIFEVCLMTFVYYYGRRLEAIPNFFAQIF